MGTAPIAAQSVLPLLSVGLAHPTRDALWRVTAALYTVHAGDVTAAAACRGSAGSR